MEWSSIYPICHVDGGGPEVTPTPGVEQTLFGFCVWRGQPGTGAATQHSFCKYCEPNSVFVWYGGVLTG